MAAGAARSHSIPRGDQLCPANDSASKVRSKKEYIMTIKVDQPKLTQITADGTVQFGPEQIVEHFTS